MAWNDFFLPKSLCLLYSLKSPYLLKLLLNFMVPDRYRCNLRLCSQMLTFAIKKLLTRANGQKEDAASFLCLLSFFGFCFAVIFGGIFFSVILWKKKQFSSSRTLLLVRLFGHQLSSVCWSNYTSLVLQEGSTIWVWFCLFCKAAIFTFPGVQVTATFHKIGQNSSLFTALHGPWHGM